LARIGIQPITIYRFLSKLSKLDILKRGQADGEKYSPRESLLQFLEKIANLTSEKKNFAYLTSNLHFLHICPQIHFSLPISHHGDLLLVIAVRIPGGPHHLFGCGINGLGWIQPSFWGWSRPIHLFGCTSDFGDGVNPSYVWLKELGIRVGCHDNTIFSGVFALGPLNFSKINEAYISKPFSLAFLHQDPKKSF